MFKNPVADHKNVEAVSGSITVPKLVSFKI